MIIISHIFLSLCNLRASIVGFFETLKQMKNNKGKYHSIYLHVLHVHHKINYHEFIAKLLCVFVFLIKGKFYYFPMLTKILYHTRDSTRGNIQIISKYGILSEKFGYYWLVRLVSCTDSFSKTFPTWVKMNQYLLMKDYTTLKEADKLWNRFLTTGKKLPLVYSLWWKTK